MEKPEELIPCEPVPCPPLKETTLSASGGWYAPSETLYQMMHEPDTEIFPKFTTNRGGVEFPQDLLHTGRSPYMEALQAYARSIVRRQDATVEAACEVALANGWDVNIYRNPRPWATFQYIGIAFEKAEFKIPTIRWHLDVDATFDDDEDWENAYG